MSPRTFHVRAAEAGRSLADFLADQLRLTRRAVERLVLGGQVRIAADICSDARRLLKTGERVVISFDERPTTAATTEKAPRPAIVFADAHLVVVNKPPGLTTMRHAHEAEEFGARARRFLPPTLQDLLPELLGKREVRVRAVHRLDNETSGLVVFALTAGAERGLGKQFRAHTTERLYRALVRGRARDGRIESWLVRDRGDGRRGSGAQSDDAQRAVTHVRVIERLGDFSLVECRLETGRTHQVRIHLGEAGTPLCGERIYDRPVHGQPMADGSGATRVMLHAATLGVDHPATGQRTNWAAPLPADMADQLKRLRRNSRS
jgi:23S rRNA pseudouridine1911/1915/1917 synthase